MKRFIKYLPFAILLLAACSKAADGRMNNSDPSGQPEEYGHGDTIEL